MSEKLRTPNIYRLQELYREEIISESIPRRGSEVPPQKRGLASYMNTDPPPLWPTLCIRWRAGPAINQRIVITIATYNGFYMCACSSLLGGLDSVGCIVGHPVSAVFLIILSTTKTYPSFEHEFYYLHTTS